MKLLSKTSGSSARTVYNPIPSELGDQRRSEVSFKIRKKEAEWFHKIQEITKITKHYDIQKHVNMTIKNKLKNLQVFVEESNFNYSEIEMSNIDLKRALGIAVYNSNDQKNKESV